MPKFQRGDKVKRVGTDSHLSSHKKDDVRIVARCTNFVIELVGLPGKFFHADNYELTDEVSEISKAIEKGLEA